MKQISVGKWFKARYISALFVCMCLLCSSLLASDYYTAQSVGSSNERVQKEKTLVVTAVGVADPNADAYKRDQSLMLEDLRADAKKQCIEKAVGSMVSAQSLVENYVLIEDKVHSRTAGLIKRVIGEGSVDYGSDGFARLVMTAEVYLSGIEDALDGMSRFERIDQIKDKGNPTIAVSVIVRDATRSGPKNEERSELAENILKEMFSDFGYRVWSQGGGSGERQADFVVTGEVQFEHIVGNKMGVAFQQHKLVAWTIKCVDGGTGEQLLFNNVIPRNGRTSWSSEAAAQEDIGTKIGSEFNQEFFDRHLMRPSTIYQLTVKGLTDYDGADEIRAEFLGLRPVLNADLRNFDEENGALFEIDIIGKRENFMSLLNGVIVKPLNERYGKGYLKIKSAAGQETELVLDEKKKRIPERPKSTVASTDASSLTEQTSSRSNSIASLPWIILAVVVVGAGIAFVLMKKR